MNVLSEIQSRFRHVLVSYVDDPAALLDMSRPAQDPKFGDYQANCAMSLGKTVNKPPREVAADIVAQLNIADLCQPPEIAGPGFINLRLRDDWIVAQLENAIHDQRVGVSTVSDPKTFVIDYSSPNVAKPMHVGHIRSTVIGDALGRTLRFLGHHVISDNHLGDWGTQFGMIIYGYKHFLDRAAYETNPVAELGRLYKLVSQLVEYHNGVEKLPQLASDVDRRAALLEEQRSSEANDKAAAKKHAKALRKLEGQVSDARKELQALEAKLAAVRDNPELGALAANHPNIAAEVLHETARLHEGDPENTRLWHEFLPRCREDIQRIYDRVDIQFDYEYGESFYHDMLASVVEDFQAKGLARESDGAICVFLDGFEAPMIIRKKDGAFLYSTTDLATIKYRLEHWNPDVILYVVDHRQSEHFDKLFAACRLWDIGNVELRHISFGTVLGNDGKPYKTRSGDTVGLEGLLDDAVEAAYVVVCENDRDNDIPEPQRRHVAHVVGHAAIKYADLSHNRTSDYKFDKDKMVAMEGNTATYMQYSYARIMNIFAKCEVDSEAIRDSGAAISISEPQERALAIRILQFQQALDDTVADYRPNQLTDYLFDLAQEFSRFYDRCPVLKAESAEVRASRLLLCDLAARVIRQGLSLLGIRVVDKM